MRTSISVAWVSSAIAAAAVSVLFTAPVAAQGADLRVVAAEGSAKVDGRTDGDSAQLRQARREARDEAFARAVDRMVDALVPAGERRRADSEIQERIVRKARVFVAKFKVRSQAVEGGGYRVALDAWIDVGKLRQALMDVGVDMSGADGAASDARPSIALLVRAQLGEGVQATFGRVGTDGGAIGRQLKKALRDHGFEIVTTSGLEVSLVESPESVLPLSDSSAMELAQRAGAGAAIVVGARVLDEGKIRGTTLRGARAQGVVRVLDVRDDKVVSEIEAQGAGFGSVTPEALHSAAENLAEKIMGAISAPLAVTWPEPVPRDGGVLVEIRGAHEWRVVHEIMRVLSKAPGVHQVTVRSMRRRYVALAVDTGLSNKRVQAALSQARFGDAKVSVVAGDDDIVRVDVLGALRSVQPRGRARR